MLRLNGRWLMIAGAVALSLALCACEHKPEGLDDDPEAAIQKEKNAVAPQSAIEVGDALASLQKRAESGDISAMVALGRAHEAIGGTAHKAEAIKWYEKAAATGDGTAKESLRMMEAQAAAATRRDAEELAAATRAAAAATMAAAVPTPSTIASGATALPTTAVSASTHPTSAPAVAAGKLGDVAWSEVLNCFDNHDFVTMTRPGYRKKATDSPIFVGLTSRPDKTLTVAASGPVGDNLDAVSIVLRLRNRQNIDRNNRVLQTAAIARTITRGNVDNKEMADWVQQYLLTGARAEPVFRNGWSIRVGDTPDDGRPDPKKYLGELVLIEMKK